MKDKYSETMQKLMRKQPKQIVHGTIWLLLLLLLIGIIYGLWDINRQETINIENAVEFEPYQSEEIYSQLKPDFMLPEFAVSYDERIYYCFAFRKDLRLSIVAVWEENMWLYQELIDYTISEEIVQEEPETVILEGIPVKIDEEMIDLIVEAYNTFMGSELIDNTNYQLVVGNYYLDTTQGPEVDPGLFVFSVTFFIIAGTLYMLLLINSRKKEKVRQRTLSQYDELRLLEVDQELEEPSIVAHDKIIFTKNYMISNKLGFEIVPYHEVVHVYGHYNGGAFDSISSSLIAETKDSIKHEFAIKRGSLMDLDNNSVLNEMKLRMPEIDYGYEDGFIKRRTDGYHIEVDTRGAEDRGKSNVLLGILGALLGAALGGVLWIIIGSLGFIAGLAGYFMMYFAILGYRRFSGFLDKRGQIISLVIAVLMIFVANCSLYVLQFAKGLYGNYNISSITMAIRGLPDFLSEIGGWTDFLRDLAIGYGLSTIASINLLKSIFSKQ